MIAPIYYVDEFKYLFVTLRSGKSISFSVKSDLRSFYKAINSIFCSSTCPNEPVVTRLLYTNYVPILSYLAQSKSMILKICHHVILPLIMP